VKTLRTETGVLRRVLVEALGKRGDLRAVPALVDVLDDPDAEVRRRAVRALEQLTGESFGPDARAWERWWRSRPKGRR
jgi:HEAT repeat protein